MENIINILDNILCIPENLELVFKIGNFNDSNSNFSMNIDNEHFNIILESMLSNEYKWISQCHSQFVDYFYENTKLRIYQDEICFMQLKNKIGDINFKLDNNPYDFKLVISQEFNIDKENFCGNSNCFYIKQDRHSFQDGYIRIDLTKSTYRKNDLDYIDRLIDIEILVQEILHHENDNFNDTIKSEINHFFILFNDILNILEPSISITPTHINTRIYNKLIKLKTIQNIHNETLHLPDNPESFEVLFKSQDIQNPQG